MSSSPAPSGIRTQIESEQQAFPPAARAMADAIRDKHGACVRAFLFYGSARREGDAAGKMIDFYVLVDRYRSIHGRGLRQLASFLIPPSVHYHETLASDGQTLRGKYAVISARAFHRRARGGAFESMLWGRFSQPALVDAASPEEHNALIETLSLACQHLARETLPLLKDVSDLDNLWTRGFAESYRTELRPENAEGRARELVSRFDDRYAALSAALFGTSLEDRQAALDEIGALQRFTCRTRWAVRRVIGKVMAALRVVKAAFTFDAGLDYILEKLEGHSDARIEVTERERRHPLLHAPFLAWKMLRARALR